MSQMQKMIFRKCGSWEIKKCNHWKKLDWTQSRRISELEERNREIGDKEMKNITIKRQNKDRVKPQPAHNRHFRNRKKNSKQGKGKLILEDIMC